jgi:hypothetical protein
MAEKLPQDATIDQVAEVFGVADRVEDLTPEARRLTKGQMVAILGAEDATAAAWQVVTPAYPSTSRMNRNASSQGLQLAVTDIDSIREVFGDAFPPEDRAVMISSLVTAQLTDRVKIGETLDETGWTIYVCCCPCCCATAVIEPTTTSVA